MGVQWTEEQRQVIELGGRNILVSAAAGSGKSSGAGGTNHYHAHQKRESCGCRPAADRDIYRGSSGRDERAYPTGN